MSSKRKAAAKRKGEGDRPSLFFVVMLVAGLILLVWLFIQGAAQMKPADGTPPANQTQT